MDHKLKMLETRGHSDPKKGLEQLDEYAEGGEKWLKGAELRQELAKIYEGAISSYREDPDVADYYAEHIRSIGQFVQALKGSGDLRSAFKGIMRTAETIKDFPSGALYHYDPIAAAGFMDRDIESFAGLMGVKADYLWYQIMEYLTS